MRKLSIFEHISLDGVIQVGGPGGDPEFPYGDWSGPYRTPEGRERLVKRQPERFDLLLGRRTYDLWSGSWPKAPRGPLADPINAATKYVVTHRKESLAWGPFEAVGPDIVKDVRRVKAQSGPDLIVWGSSTITSALLEHGLADEIVLLTYPVLLGKGKRLFADGTPPRAFELVNTSSLPSGIVTSTYKPAGGLKNEPTR